METTRDIWLGILRRADMFGRAVLMQDSLIPPMSFILFTDDAEGLRNFVVPELRDAQQRAEIFGLVAMIATATQAYGVCVMGEPSVALFYQRPGEDYDAFKTRAMSAEAPNEQDDLQAVCATVVVYRDSEESRAVISCCTPINRSSDGKVKDFGAPLISGDGQVVFGSVVNLLPAGIPTSVEAIAAGAWLVKRGASEMKRLGVFAFRPEISR